MASRRRTLPKAEPLDLDRELDEMYSSAITRPNLGFLRVGESPAPPVIATGGDQYSSAVGETDASSDSPSMADTSMDARSIDVSASTRSIDTVSLDTRSLDTGSRDPVSMDVRPAGKWKLHRCLTVQDGHSANEQLLYEMLWRSAKAVNPDERLLAISREDMASQTRITVRNVKGVLDRLIEKLAIERVIESNSFIRAAATYRVYSYRAILDRRRMAGLEWVTRANGVKFIAAKTAQEILSRPKFTEADSRQPSGAFDHISSDAGAGTKDLASLDSASMDDRYAVLRALGIGLRKINPAFDSAAVATLWRECRTSVPDCTVEEVLHFSSLRAITISADKSIRNSVGFLLSSVPEFFDQNTVHEFRMLLSSKDTASMDDR
jgi:hypothetical protein